MAEQPPPPYRRPTLPWERRAEGGYGWARWSSVGIEFGAVVAVFFLGGRWLDGRLSTGPWLTLTGALVGVTAGMILLIRAALKGSAATSAEPLPTPRTLPTQPPPADSPTHRPPRE